MPSRVRASLACKRLHKFPAGNGGNENSPGDSSWGSEKKGETLAFLRPASPGDRCPRSDEPARSNNKKLNRWSEPEKTVGQKKKAPVRQHRSYLREHPQILWINSSRKA